MPYTEDQLKALDKKFEAEGYSAEERKAWFQGLPKEDERRMAWERAPGFGQPYPKATWGDVATREARIFGSHYAAGLNYYPTAVASEFGLESKLHPGWPTTQQVREWGPTPEGIGEKALAAGGEMAGIATPLILTRGRLRPGLKDVAAAGLGGAAGEINRQALPETANPFTNFIAGTAPSVLLGGPSALGRSVGAYAGPAVAAGANYVAGHLLNLPHHVSAGLGAAAGVIANLVSRGRGLDPRRMGIGGVAGVVGEEAPQIPPNPPVNIQMPALQSPVPIPALSPSAGSAPVVPPLAPY